MIYPATESLPRSSFWQEDALAFSLRANRVIVPCNSPTVSSSFWMVAA